MKISEALAQRIPRVRLSVWADPHAYLRLPLLVDGKIGPWAELYDERTQRDVLGIKPGSQRILVLGASDTADYEVYTGPVSDYEQENYARVYLES